MLMSVVTPTSCRAGEIVKSPAEAYTRPGRLRGPGAISGRPHQRYSPLHVQGGKPTMNGPPFRADQVGSLLRPTELHEARARAKAGAISVAQLADVEDRCIRAAVARQESLGLRAVTDGEYRRDFWHLDFLRRLEGVGLAPVTGMKFQAEDAPAMLHLRGGRRTISREHYPDLARFWADAAAAYRTAIGHIAAAGCTYLQLDDVSFAYLCDPRVREGLRAVGDDPATLPRAYADAINEALRDRPAGMTVTLHTCRGNFRSTWLAAGGYENTVVEAMFSTAVDGYFMEWDSERAGGFEPLRLLPKNKKVVLGLVTTKSGVLESKETLKRRIDEATKHVPLERLALSPQCGFASTHHGNTLTEDDQWRKLALVVEVAHGVWGD